MISIAIAARFSECNIESIDTKLHTYAHSGDVKGLREVLLSTSSARSGSNENLINKRNHLGCTALRLAATSGHIDCVDILLSHGAKTDIADIKGQTPLFVSVKNGHIKCVETLLRHGANPEGGDDVMYSPLYIASMNGYNEILQLLIKYGADLDQRRTRVYRSFRNDPLQIAIAYHHYNCCKTLLCAGYDANAVVSMVTMYHVADKHKCDVKFLKLLYEFGVHFFTRDQKGKYPWELEPFETKDSAICSKYLISIKGGHIDCVDMLLYHGAKTDIADIKGKTPLFLSVKNGHIKCVEMLLRHGANPEGGDDAMYYPLYIASMNGYNEILQLLIKYGAHLDQRVHRSFRNDPLQIAVAYRHYNCCKTLLCAGYDANVAVSMDTMYHVAVKHTCDVKFLKLLYEFGVHFFTRDQKGKYPWELEPFETKDSAICSKYLISIKENSRSLLSACRLTIRKSMRDLKTMNQLCLPVCLLDYLNYKHL